MHSQVFVVTGDVQEDQAYVNAEGRVIALGLRDYDLFVEKMDERDMRVR